MTDPRELLGAYAAQARYYVPLSALSPEGRKGPSRSREDVAPKAFAALNAVLDLHKPEDAEPAYDPGKTFCCTGCMDSYGEYNTYPCRTVKAITTALEATDG